MEREDTPGRDSAVGVLHLLDRDDTSLCSSPFGLLTSSAARSTCASCSSIWHEAKHAYSGRPLVADDADEIGH